jgi:hypothetical protein
VIDCEDVGLLRRLFDYFFDESGQISVVNAGDPVSAFFIVDICKLNWLKYCNSSVLRGLKARPI